MKIWLIAALHNGSWVLEEDRFWTNEKFAKKHFAQWCDVNNYRLVAYVPDSQSSGGAESK